MVPNEGTFVRYKFTIIMTFVTLVSFDIKRIISQKNEKNKITFIFNHAAYFVSHRLKLVKH